MYSLGEARYAFAHGEAKDWGEHWREVGERQRLRRVQSEGRHGKTHDRTPTMSDTVASVTDQRRLDMWWEPPLFPGGYLLMEAREGAPPVRRIWAGT